MAKSANDVRIRKRKDTINQLNKTIDNLNRTIGVLNRQLSDNEQLMAEMKAEMALLRKKLYGSSKERTVPVDNDRLNFFSEFVNEPDPIPEIIEPEHIKVTYKKSRKKKPTLEEQFKDIPVKQVIIDSLTDENKTCPACDTPMKAIGKEVIRREVVHVKPSMYMVEYIATTYSCPKRKDTEDPQFAKDDDAPKALIESSYASASLAAWAFYQKFAMSVPFYRLEKSFEELGAKISRTTMANWAVQCDGKYFKPITDHFHRKLLRRQFIMMDETPIQVLNEPDKRPESKSYVWLMRSGEDGESPIVCCHYSPSRSGDVALELLDGIKSGTYLMCDGFSGYNKLKDVKRCRCYARIRRYLYEAIPSGRGNDLTHPAVQGVMYCNKLFEYERRYAEKGLSYKQRQNRGLKDEKPVIEAFLDMG